MLRAMADADNDNSSTLQMPQEAPAVGGAPAAVGMMTPQLPDGEIESAKLDAFHACRLIDRAVARLGRESDYTNALMEARAALTKKFGEFEEDSERYSPAELDRMVARIRGAGDPGQQPQQQQQQPNPAAPQQGGMQ